MSLFFPDLNVWLALSVSRHSHSASAWKWLKSQPEDARLIFSRYTQIGLLRLLTNPAVMGEQTLVVRQAWEVYDRWLEDFRVAFYPEPSGINTHFRQATEPFGMRPASKWIGDCWLLANAVGVEAALVTFDQALHEFARKQGHPAVVPG